jgi:hypothetical protein
MLIALDFDDTLMDTKNVLEGYRMGQPEPGAILATQHLHNLGHTLIVFTARDVQDPRVKKAVMDWCEHFKIPVSGVTNIKSPHFQVMIDNRNLRFTSWPQTLVDLTNLENNQ